MDETNDHAPDVPARAPEALADTPAPVTEPDLSADPDGEPGASPTRKRRRGSRGGRGRTRVAGSSDVQQEWLELVLITSVSLCEPCRKAFVMAPWRRRSRMCLRELLPTTPEQTPKLGHAP